LVGVPHESIKAVERNARSFPLVNYLPVAVYVSECQLVNHVALVQLDSVDTEPMDTCNAIMAPSESVWRGHVNGVGVEQSWVSIGGLEDQV
jgi:hypothetical protein